MLPWAFIAILAGVALALCLLAAWRRLPGWWLRALAVGVLALALADPSLQTEEREPLSDILLIVVDESASQHLSDRPAQSAAALEGVLEEAARDGLDTRVARVSDSDGDEGTLAMGALGDMLSEVPRDRVAGAVIISDGQVHDVAQAPDLPAPLHLLRTGRAGDWDRRLVVSNAPAFAILDEEFTITLRIEDQGDVPPGMGDAAEILLAVDGGQPRAYRIPVGVDLELPVVLPHGGRNVLEFSVPEAEGELTARNNDAVIQINGVRDRLRVLLVSGEPHPGQRTWRNLLKADAAVDLVHFTILRPPGKQDGVPVGELSLIAFPTRELFSEKIDEFDLIIFDRYQRRGILPAIYFENVRDYVAQGGGLLVAAGPDFATADSLYRSEIAEVLPAAPTAIVIDTPFLPAISATGEKHPVTEGLPADYGTDGDPWGRWFRQVQLEAKDGAQVVMTGEGEEPLLILDRVGNGRVALLGSDHAWLWDRGVEGGGPQAELLRRVAHWLMQEPELEEEALVASASGQEITVTRRTLGDAPGPVAVTAPDGSERVMTLEREAPGRFVGRIAGAEQGLWRFSEGERNAVIGLGPAAPREFVETIAADDVLAPVIRAHRGGALAVEDGVPDLRAVREGRQAAGRGWIGWTPRNAYLTADLRVLSLVPAWMFLLLAAGLSTWAWLREGRR
ncbi:glutamine amidotransferase [Jannaschia seosinensis]|nr:glutamine amidotransferase [Jannaschia seosinensis]